MNQQIDRYGEGGRYIDMQLDIDLKEICTNMREGWQNTCERDREKQFMLCVRRDRIRQIDRQIDRQRERERERERDRERGRKRDKGTET